MAYRSPLTTPPELLIHVTAPATVRDDKRYLSIVQSILDFQPIVVTEAAAVHPDHAQLESFDHATTWSLPSTQILSQPEQMSQVLVDRSIISKSARTPLGNSHKRRRSCHTIVNSFHLSHENIGTRSVSPPISVIETPTQSRPTTTSEVHLPSVVIPRTAKARKRAQLDFLLSENPPPWVSDSISPLEYTSASHNHPRHLTEPSLENHLHNNRNRTSFWDVPQRKRSRLHGGGCTGRTCSLAFAESGARVSFLREASLNRTPASCANSDIPTNSGPCIESSPKPSPLTERAPGRSRHDRGSSTSFYSGSVQPRASEWLYSAANEQMFPIQQQNSRIWTLPLEVSAPPPPVGYGKFKSHITTQLRELETRLPFRRYFRPMHVLRDVQVLERGHWSMAITIAPNNVVLEARRSPDGARFWQALMKRFYAPTASERMSKYWTAKAAGNGLVDGYNYGFEDAAIGLWTEDEFVQFWQNYSAFVQDGKAGWGVRMVREADAHTKTLRLKIYTWGELIGHSYLAIWVLSDKASGRTPMEWIAGDGHCVVKMAGTKAGRGSATLGVWQRKGGEDETEVWGIA